MPLAGCGHGPADGPSGRVMNISWSDLFLPQQGPLAMFVRGTVIYWFVFLLLRMAGRREVGSLGVADLIVLLLVADAAHRQFRIGSRTCNKYLLLTFRPGLLPPHRGRRRARRPSIRTRTTRTSDCRQLARNRRWFGHQGAQCAVRRQPAGIFRPRRRPKARISPLCPGPAKSRRRRRRRALIRQLTRIPSKAGCRRNAAPRPDAVRAASWSGWRELGAGGPGRALLCGLGIAFLLGQQGQLLVGGLFLGQRFLQQLDRVSQSQLLA